MTAGDDDHATDEAPDGGPDSQPDWADLDTEASIAMGILTELTAIRQALEAIAGEQASDGPVQEPIYECKACGARIAGTRIARDHAISDHSAPADGESWQHLMEIES